MKRLASPLSALKPHYDVVVIGSGYGGSIAASRMARAGRQVCLLERGKEFLPGEFPDQQWEAATEMQLDLPDKHIGPRTGLYNFHVNPDINVLVGCGLGGTSLINANVSLKPERWVLEADEWPAALRHDQAQLDQGFARATEMLKPVPFPETLTTPAKLAALQAGAAGFGDNVFYRPPINVNFEDKVNHVGVHQEACPGCGDCVSGCNTGAKNTTAMTYLPDAKNFGAEIFTEVGVQWIEQVGDRWRVFYEHRSGRKRFNAPELFVSADLVVLAAGALGSTEILLRSRARGLHVSPRLGESFTGNGDFLGFAFNNDIAINGVGTGLKEVNDADRCGPCITGIIDLRKAPAQQVEGMVIEEGVIPSALAKFVPQALLAAADLTGKDTDRDFADNLKEWTRRLGSMVKGAYDGAVKNTMTYLVMTHDNAKGRMELEKDRLHIAWPGAGTQKIFEKVSENLRKVTQKLGGTYIKNPTWNKVMKHNLTTVHPLGGCAMGETVQTGVVNHKGQVFSGKGDTAVYEGLYVTCGAIVPRTLGVNPLLTISALAERICHYMAADRGWSISYDFPALGPEPEEETRPGIKFTERMNGFFSLYEKEDYARGERVGKEENSPFSFILTIESPDLEKMMEDPQHEAAMFGTVEAPALSPDPLIATEGTFNLFVADEEHQEGRYMRYRMQLTSEEGHTYFFEGHKVIRDDRGFDLWKDTTTLFVTLYEGADERAPVLGKGILHIDPDDFRRQMTTIKVLNTSKRLERLATQARFAKFFAANLIDVYA
ncbi:cholesterol oxidase [Catalinimonas alkaloidigena]|uniref:Cholesterol oxidase n=1 Tax=Catalinimonas alkaloidigena TaxID=1075417 RepID=A0A1G9GDK7_9BACT|nr:GMC family oxidoreductase [Catalinimonas alkaloidigena]SDK98720.1 cholesterol oxidase [Catalinimonas alkaloidigena]